MLVLAIDTSSAAVSAAVVDATPAGQINSAPIQRVTVDARAHAELLAPSIRSCLDEAGASARDLAAVVVGLGPGPFTGLRVGVVTAAAMADALDIPAYGVCSLDAIAHALARSGTLLVAGDARRREVYWCRYVDGVRVSGPGVGRPAEVAASGAPAPMTGAPEPMTGAPEFMAGAGARLYADVLAGALLDCDYPPPASVAELAMERVVGRAPSEVLTPLYLRRPDAVEPGASKPVTP